MITLTQTTKQTITAVLAMWRRAVVAAVISPRMSTCVFAVASHRNNRDAKQGSGI